MQQMRRINDAPQSLQKLRFLQQERNHSAGLIEKEKETGNLTKRWISGFLL